MKANSRIIFSVISSIRQQMKTAYEKQVECEEKRGTRPSHSAFSLKPRCGCTASQTRVSNFLHGQKSRRNNGRNRLWSSFVQRTTGARQVPLSIVPDHMRGYQGSIRCSQVMHHAWLLCLAGQHRVLRAVQLERQPRHKAAHLIGMGRKFDLTKLSLDKTNKYAPKQKDYDKNEIQTRACSHTGRIRFNPKLAP